MATVQLSSMLGEGKQCSMEGKKYMNGKMAVGTVVVGKAAMINSYLFFRLWVYIVYMVDQERSEVMVTLTPKYFKRR